MQRNVWGRLLFPARALPGIKLECAGSLRFEVATPLGEDGESCRRLNSLLEQVVPPRTGRLGCRGWLRPLGISSGNSGTPRRRSVSQDKALLGVATGRCQVGENTGYKMHLRWGRETKPQEKSGWHGGPACLVGACWDWAWSEAQRITWEPPEDVLKEVWLAQTQYRQVPLFTCFGARYSLLHHHPTAAEEREAHSRQEIRSRSFGQLQGKSKTKATPLSPFP